MPTASKTYGLKACQYCGEKFEAHRPNMIYCDNICCRRATNEKLLKRYHERKKEKNSIRTCKTCSGKLSRYNKDDECHACQIKEENANRTALLAELGIKYIDEDVAN